MKNEIIISSNIIGGRQGSAYICNSRRFRVFYIDLDMPQRYADFKAFCPCKVVYSTRNHGELDVVGQIEFNENKWQIGGNGGVCLSADFGFDDISKMVTNAGLQTVREGETVALAFVSRSCRVATLNLFKVGRVDPHCMTIAQLIPLNDEEMEQIKIDADKWCVR